MQRPPPARSGYLDRPSLVKPCGSLTHDAYAARGTEGGREGKAWDGLSGMSQTGVNAEKEKQFDLSSF